MTVEFENAWMLYLLWLAPVGAAWMMLSISGHREKLRRMVAPSLRSRLCPETPAARFVIQAVAVAGSLLLLILAGARPRWGASEFVRLPKARNIVVALDVSRSMLASDVAPSRLERAKMEIADLLDELRGDRIAIVAFRHKPILLCPLTADYVYAREALASAGPDCAVPGETDIGAALDAAFGLLADKTAEGHSAIIMVSDGEDLAGSAGKAVASVRHRRIPVFAIGVGTVDGGQVPDPVTRGVFLHEGRDVVTRLNPGLLRLVAAGTGGAYVSPDPRPHLPRIGGAAASIYRQHISKLGAAEFEEAARGRAVERYQVFLLPALLLLLAALLLGEGRAAVFARSASARAAPAVMVLALSIVASAPSSATGSNLDPDWLPEAAGARGDAATAQELYAEGRYAQAAETYLAASEGASAARTEILEYNAAVSYFRHGAFRRAAAILRRIATRPMRMEAEVWHALGCALFRLAQGTEQANADAAWDRARTLGEAAAAFQNAVRTGGERPAGERNLFAALEALGRAEEDAEFIATKERYGSLPPFGLAHEVLERQRGLVKSARAAFSDDSPARILNLREHAVVQKRTAVLWQVLRERLKDPAHAAIAAGAEEQGRLAREDMLKASAGMRDLERDACAATVSAERRVYEVWKMLAPGDAALQEDLRRQSNALAAASSAVGGDRSESALPDQAEAQALTCLFIERFGATNAQEGARARVPPDVSENILRLAGRAGERQEQAVQFLASGRESQAIPEQEASMALLMEADRLLRQYSSCKEPEQAAAQARAAQANDRQAGRPENVAPPELDAEPKDKQLLTLDDVRELMDKALAREMEYKEDLRRRRWRPSSRVERDW